MPPIPPPGEGEYILIRTPNWVGDAVFAAPAIRALGDCSSRANLVLFGPRSICDLLGTFDGVAGAVGLDAREAGAFRHRFGAAWKLRDWRAGFAWVFPESFSSALETKLGGARIRVGRPTEGRGFLLTHRVPFTARPRSRHLVDEYLELVESLGVDVHERTPRVSIDPAAAAEAGRLLPPNEGGLRIGLIPGAAFGAAKRWPPDRFVRLSRRFAGDQIVLFGSSEERFLAEHISSSLRARTVVLAGRTNLKVLAACLARCSIVVGNDTGPTHLAAAVGTPVVGVYGSTNPGWTGVRSPRSRIVRRVTDCAPCYSRQCDRGYACLHEITVEEVWNACRELLTGDAAKSNPGPPTATGRES